MSNLRLVYVNGRSRVVVHRAVWTFHPLWDGGEKVPPGYRPLYANEVIQEGDLTTTFLGTGEFEYEGRDWETVTEERIREIQDIADGTNEDEMMDFKIAWYSTTVRKL